MLKVSNKNISAIFMFISGVMATVFTFLFITPDPFYVAELPDGSKYDGEIADNRFHGKGTLTLKNRTKYEGDFYEGKYHGMGKYTVNHAFTYEGEFTNGRMTGFGTIRYNNGYIYTGQVKNAFMHGKGKYEFKDNVYEGDFVYGKYEGTGTFTYPNGETYVGEFKDNQFHGKGRHNSTDGRFYDGEFDKGSLISGTYEDGKGTKYTGGFKDWSYHGEGELIESDGTRRVGRFDYGILEGEGELFQNDGTHYKGGFLYGQFNGQGKLTKSNGDVYEGEFLYGKFEGKGTLRYAVPLNGVVQVSGTWDYGKLIKSDDGVSLISPEELNEFALYNQNALLSKSWEKLVDNDPDKIDMYFLGISGDGTQAVFRREVEYVRKQFEEKFKAGGKTVTLINSRDTVKDIPLATVTSIDKTIKAIAKKMDVENDILFLFATSHGTKDATFKLSQSNLSLPDLKAEKLKQILESTSIKWKVLVISACYSGSFIESLKNEHTMIITAASKDKKSFGCSDEREFTDFGEAYFKYALNRTDDFVSAFEIALKRINEKEHEQGKKSSEPQITKPKAIVEQLEKWIEGK